MSSATQILQPDQLELAAAALLAGELVVFPTDTVYGVAALAMDEAALAALFAAKQRPGHLALPVMLARIEQVTAVAWPTPLFYELARRFWPGPLTLILPKKNVLPPLLTAGRPTVGLRIPDHPLALRLLQRVGRPLAVTSANRSGQPPAGTAQQAWQQLAGRVRYVLDGGPAPGGQPSTVLDLTQTPPVILRPGPLSLQDLGLADGAS